tara:strand:- start:3545 stop:3988 length:444 start_codon:yes stop_codon:yes gene_type:complete
MNNEFKHLIEKKSLKGNDKDAYEEMLYHSKRGFVIKIFNQKRRGEKNEYSKIVIRQIDEDKFSIHMKDQKTTDGTTLEVNLSDLKKFLNKAENKKRFTFALNYIEKEMKGYNIKFDKNASQQRPAKKFNNKKDGPKGGTKKKKGSRK